MAFQGIFNYYPVSIAGKELTKKEGDKTINTGLYNVSVLALDNGLKTNNNGLFITNSKTPHTVVTFKIPQKFISSLSYMKPIRCLAELSPLNYDFYIKILEIEIDGEMVPIESSEDE
jgi:hypothetical protein